MRPPGLWTSIAIVFLLSVTLNFFVRVIGPNDAVSTGIVIEYLQSHSFLISLSVFLIATILIYVGSRIWGFFRGLKIPGVLDFWKTVAAHPDAAYKWFSQSSAWAIRNYPLNKGYENDFPIKDWAGPFDLWVPSIEKRVCIFGKAGHFEKTEEQFMQFITTSEAKYEKTEKCIDIANSVSVSTKDKTILEKAEDAPISFRILIDSVERQLERQYPQVLLLPRWSAFQAAATIAGCVALATQLHFEASEEQRTPAELEMRKILSMRFPNSEQAYENCYRFLTDSIVDIPRTDRGKHLFVLAAMWVYGVVSEGHKIEQKEWIIGRLAEVYQNEIIGFWRTAINTE